MVWTSEEVFYRSQGAEVHVNASDDSDFFICELNFQFHPLFEIKIKKSFRESAFRIRSSRVGFHVYKICNLDQNVDTQNNYVTGRLLINLEYHLNLIDITELISDSSGV